MAAPARLTELGLDPTCGNRANWRCDLLGETDVGALESGLAARGYAVRCRHPNLRIFRRDDGHEVAWVLSTGRVQLRIPFQVSRQDRESAARKVYADIEGVLQSASDI